MGGDTNNPQHSHSSGVSPPDPGSGMLHAPHFAAKNKVSFSRRGPMLAGSSLPQMGNGVGEARGVGGGDQPTPPPPNHTPSPSLPDPSTYPAPARPPLPAFWWRWRRWWRRRWRCAAPSAAEGPGSAPAEMGADSPPAPGRSYAAPGPAVPGSELPPTAALGARCPASLGGSLRSLRGGSWKCWGGGGRGEVGTGPSLLPSLLLSAPSRCRIASPTAKCIPAAAAGRRPTPLPPRCGSHLGDPSLCHSRISGAADEATWEPGGGQGDGNAPPNSHLFLPSPPPKLRHRSPAGGKRGPSEDCPRGAVM